MFINLKRQLFIAFISAFIGGSVSADVSGWTSQSVGKTCNYFDSLAFKDHHQGRSESVFVEISNNCQNAFRTLRVAPSKSEAAIVSATYLKNLENFRQTVVKMNVDRFKTAQRAKVGTHKLSRTVSDTGFYLIADRQGVLEFGKAFASIYRQTLYPNVAKESLAKILP